MLGVHIIYVYGIPSKIDPRDGSKIPAERESAFQAEEERPVVGHDTSFCRGILIRVVIIRVQVDSVPFEYISAVECQTETARREITVVISIVLDVREGRQPVALPVPADPFFRAGQISFVWIHLKRKASPHISETHTGVFHKRIEGGSKQLVISIKHIAGSRVYNTAAESHSDSRQAHLRLDGTFHGQGRVGSQLEIAGQPGAGKPAGTQSQMHYDGHRLIRIGPQTHRRIVGLAFCTVEYERVWFLLSFHMIGYGFKSIGTVYLVQHPFYDSPVIQTVGRIVVLVQDFVTVIIRDAGKLDLVDTYLVQCKVDSLRVMRHIRTGLVCHHGCN